MIDEIDYTKLSSDIEAGKYPKSVKELDAASNWYYNPFKLKNLIDKVTRKQKLNKKLFLKHFLKFLDFYDDLIKSSANGYRSYYYTNKIDNYLYSNLASYIKKTAKNNKKIDLDNNLITAYIAYNDSAIRQRNSYISNNENIFIDLCKLINITPDCLDLVDLFCPSIFSSKRGFVEDLIKNCNKSIKLNALLSLIDNIDDDLRDKSILRIKKILFKNKVNYNNFRIFKVACKNEKIIKILKKEYDEKARGRVLEHIKLGWCGDYYSNDFSLVRGLVSLDDTLINDIQETYIASIINNLNYSGLWAQKKLINFLKTFKDASPKKALAKIAESAGSGASIEFLIKEYPDLKKYAILI